jgi:hypothetical protein
MTGTHGAPSRRPSRSERQQLKARQREADERGRHRARWLKRGTRWGLIGLVAAGGLGWLGYSIATAKRLPPTSMADHTEENPPGHILATPLPLAIQKHMLEHADGGGPPGVIINYNCVKFRCPEGMVERLEKVARAYPAFVYLAPYPDMDVKIAMTRLGKILTLDDVDRERIIAFINE